MGLNPDEEGTVSSRAATTRFSSGPRGSELSPRNGILFVPDDPVDVQVRSAALNASARVSSGVDWLSLRLTFESEGVAVTQDELGRCLAEGRRYVRLADGSFARLDAEKVREVLLRQAEILATGGGQGGKLPLSQAGRIQELLEQVGKSNVADSARELFSKLKAIDEIKGAKKPRTLKASLRPYQEQGFHWLWFLHEIGSGGVLADDMGLGKTVQTLALLLAVKAEDAKNEDRKKPFKALIIAPTSVVTNWMREIEKFAPSLRHVVWHGGDWKERTDELEDADVIITSYALLRRDEEMLAKLHLRYAILDEAQNIKNPLSATARAAKRLKADRRLALSGTPIENRLSEIWSIFDYVSPGLLGPLDKSRSATRARSTRGTRKLRTASAPRSTRSSCAGPRVRSPRTCRRRSRAIASASSLASKQRSTPRCSKKSVRRSWARSSDRGWLAPTSRSSPASRDCDRRRAIPDSSASRGEFTDEDSGKLVALRELIETCVEGGHRVLVFSQFVSMLTLIRRAIG